MWPAQCRVGKVLGGKSGREVTRWESGLGCCCCSLEEAVKRDDWDDDDDDGGGGGANGISVSISSW